MRQMRSESWRGFHVVIHELPVINRFCSVLIIDTWQEPQGASLIEIVVVDSWYCTGNHSSYVVESTLLRVNRYFYRIRNLLATFSGTRRIPSQDHTRQYTRVVGWSVSHARISLSTASLDSLRAGRPLADDAHLVSRPGSNSLRL
jgi:hypothetical protein